MMDRRFIPVGTGNTLAFLTSTNQRSVHPRGHGEHTVTGETPSLANGSSPWARGTLYENFYSEEEKRFIPVGTGNTMVASMLLRGNAVHPRGHGEHDSVLRLRK